MEWGKGGWAGLRTNSLSAGESDENRSVDPTKDPGELGKTGDPGLRADLEGGRLMVETWQLVEKGVSYLETPHPSDPKFLLTFPLWGFFFGLGVH